MIALQKQRILWVDIARAITMLCVVIGHIIPAGDVRTVLYGFHVPLFFFLSGIFFRSDTCFKKFFIERFKNIMIPFYFFGLFAIFSYLLFGNIITPSELKSLSECLYGLIVGSVKTDCMRFNYHLWFLPALFSMNIIMYPIHRFIVFLSEKFNRSLKLFSILSTVFFFIVSQFIFTYKISSFLPLGADTALRLFPFFIAGQTASSFKGFMSPFKPVKSKRSYVICLFAVLTFFFSALLSKINEQCMTENFHVNYMRDFYGNRFLFLGAAILGITSVILFAKIIPAVKPLSYVGQKSLSILVMQKFPIMIFSSVLPFSSKLIHASNVFAVVLFSVVTIIVCLAANVVIEKYLPFVYGKTYNKK